MKKHKYIMLLVVLLFSQFLTAQRISSKISEAIEQQANFQPINTLLTPNQPTNTGSFKHSGKAQFFDYNQNVANQIIAQPPGYMALEIPDSDYVLELMLVPQSFGKYNLVLNGDKTEHQQAPSQAHYRGVVRGFETQSIVALSLFAEEMIGWVSISGQTPINIRKVSRHSNIGLFPDNETIEPGNEKSCHTTAEHQNERLETIYKNINKQQFNPPDSSKCVNIYVEIDYQIYTHFGSIVLTNNFVAGLFNQVATLYYNESIVIDISEVFIWTSPDSYSNLVTQGLSDFVAYRPTYNGDLAMLLSYRPYGSTAGIANGIGGLCSNSLNLTAHSHTSLYPDYMVVPNYSGQVKVVTHEIGHTLGSRHTHACVWNGNNTAIDGCAGQTEGSCSLPPVPSIGGTIMSYCNYPYTNVGIDFNLGFGPQPGDVIRNLVNSAECLKPCYVTNCVETLELSGVIYDNQYYEASDLIKSEQQLVKYADVEYVAGNKIILKPGFKARELTTFKARIGECQPAYSITNTTVSNSLNVDVPDNPFKKTTGAEHQLTCMPNPFSNQTTVKYFLEADTKVSFTVFDLNGRLIYSIDKENQLAGNHQFNFYSKEIPPGMYFLKMQAGNQIETTKIMVTR